MTLGHETRWPLTGMMDLRLFAVLVIQKVTEDVFMWSVGPYLWPIYQTFPWPALTLWTVYYKCG